MEVEGIDLPYTSVKALLQCGLKKYEQVRKLLDEQSKNDPGNEPYRSQYAARDTLTELRSDVAKMLDHGDVQLNSKVHSRLTTLLAAINYQIGVVCIATEEFSAGEELLIKCYHLISGGNADDNNVDVDRTSCTRERVLLAMFTLNQLGILWSMRGELERSIAYLERSRTIYNIYGSEVGQAPCDIRDLFAIDEDESADHLRQNWKVFEKAFTHTVYYMAQVYSGLDEPVKSATYCHTTLRRQLEHLEAFDPVEWAANAAGLSQFFINRNDFWAARHHLACATHVLEQHEAQVSAATATAEDEEQQRDREELLERIRHRRADVAVCWAKYGNMLLSESWERLGRHPVCELVAAMATPNSRFREYALMSPSDESEKPSMAFKSLEVTSIEERVTANYIHDFDEARPVFLATQQWLLAAKNFFTLDGYASDHAEIVRDMSRLYRNLVPFESNDDRCCKLHKRRIDLLESELAEFNPKYYLSICRQLQFELAETYSELMNLKLNRLDGTSGVQVDQQEHNASEQSTSRHVVRKVNHLVTQGAKYYHMFLDTFKDKNGEMPEKYPSEQERAVLLAHFFIARLHSKLIVFDRQEKLEQLRRSIEEYQFVSNYCERNPTVADDMTDELWICKEMIQLLPKKIDKIISDGFF